MPSGIHTGFGFRQNGGRANNTDISVYYAGTEELRLNGTALLPRADASLDLGSTAVGFNDLHLGAGGVVNFNGGDLTLSHSTNLLTIAGGSIYLGSGLQFIRGTITGGTATSDGDGSTGLTPSLQSIGVGTAFAGGSLLLATYNTTNTAAVAPHLVLLKGGAATQVSTTAVADNEVLGVIGFAATDGTDAESYAAAIYGVVDDASGPTTGEMGGSLEFYTTSDGGETLTLSFTVNNNQNIYVQNNNGVAIGHTALLDLDADAVTPELQLLGTGAADSRFSLGRFSADAGSPRINFFKSRVATIGGANTTVVDNDEVGALVFIPDDGTDNNTRGARYIVEVDDASPAAGDVGMAHYWTSMGGGAVAEREVMRISAAGNITFGANTPTLAVTGTRIAQSYHTNITSTNAVTVDSSETVKHSIEAYQGDAMRAIMAMDVITFEHDKWLDSKGGRRLGIRAESVLEPLALTMIERDGGGQYPGLNLYGLAAIHTKAIQELESRLAKVGA